MGRYTKQEAEAAIYRNVNYVKKRAEIFMKAYPGIPRDYLDELISAGNLALVLAAQRFDTERQVEFLTFATPYINGRILNAIYDLWNRGVWRGKFKNGPLPRFFRADEQNTKNDETVPGNHSGYIPTTQSDTYNIFSKALLDCLEQVEPQKRVVFFEYVLAQETFPALANKYKTNENTIKTRYYSTRDFLKKCLERKELQSRKARS